MPSGRKLSTSVQLPWNVQLTIFCFGWMNIKPAVNLVRISQSAVSISSSDSEYYCYAFPLHDHHEELNFIEIDSLHCSIVLPHYKHWKLKVQFNRIAYSRWPFVGQLAYFLYYAYLQWSTLTPCFATSADS